MREAMVGLRGAVRFQAPLAEYTSFKIGGPADVLVEPADVEDVRTLILQGTARKIPLFVVGGTNLLIRDGGIRGIVVSLSKLRAIKEEPGSVLYAEGGVGMPTLIGHAIRRSLAGLEWAAGIPGNVSIRCSATRCRLGLLRVVRTGPIARLPELRRLGRTLCPVPGPR